MIDENKYAIIVKLSQKTDRSRLVEAAKAVKETLEVISKNNAKLFFSSEDGKSFGFFIKTEINAGMIRANLYGETRNSGTASLLNDDSALIVELGRDYSAFGFSNSWHWLQH